MFAVRCLLVEPDRPKRYLKFKTLETKVPCEKVPSQSDHSYCFPSNEYIIRFFSVLESRLIKLSTDNSTCEADNAAVLKLTILLLQFF
jgi:hypothetical protein